MKKQIKVAYFPSDTVKDTVLGSNGKSLDKYCTKCETEEDLPSGNYILDATFLIQDNLQNLLQEEAILKVLMDYGNEIFRISKVTKSTRYIDIVARQITIADSLTLWLEDVRPTDLNGTAAADWLITNATGVKEIEISSDITTVSTAYYPTMNLYEALHDCDQSFLNRWGGEILRRGYIEYINSHIGINRGFVIREGKNLNGFSGSSNIDNLITRARGKGYNGLMGNYIDSPLINNYNRVYTDVIEYQDVKVKDENSDDGYDTEAEAIAELDRRIGLEFSDNDIDKIKATYDINFVQLEKTEEYKNYIVAEKAYMGDTIRVYIPKLNTDINVRAVNKKYDCLAQKTKEVILSNYVEPKTLSMKAIIADLRTQYTQSNNNSIASYIDAIIKAGMKDSYVVLRNNELLIMDDKDINNATNVTRYNKNGLAFSTTGYYGQFTYGFTIDGKINASLIVTGILNASVIKAGILKSTNNKTWINMEDGTFNFADKITYDGTNFVLNADSVKIAVGQIGGNNLIKDSNFEFGTIAFTNVNSGVYSRLVAAGVIEGNAEGKIVCSATIDSGAYYLATGLVVGKKYTFSILRPTSSITMNLRVSNGSNWTTVANKTFGATSGVTQCAITFTATETSQKLLILNANSLAVTIYFDCLKLEEGENATAWSPNANELKSGCFEVTDEYARFTSGDGSYTEFTPSDTGLKWHKQAGDKGKDYHYLSYSGYQYTGYIQSLEHKQYPVSLPDEFKGKDFVITVGIKELNGFPIPSFVQTVTAFAASIDYDNAVVVFECYGRAWELDGSNNPVACDLAISFTYTVVA